MTVSVEFVELNFNIDIEMKLWFLENDCHWHYYKPTDHVYISKVIFPDEETHLAFRLKFGV